MENRIELAEKIAKILRRSRYERGKSQEHMAMGIGVSKKTIQNWENGTSFPNILQVEEWFRLLDMNPLQFYLEYMLPHTAANNESQDTDEEIAQNLQMLIEQVPTLGKRILLYLLSGKHGSSPYAVLQMLAAHLQVPLKDRVLNAGIILQNYEMERELKKLVCPKEVQPDLKFLSNAVYTGKSSVQRHDNSYFIVEEGEGAKNE